MPKIVSRLDLQRSITATAIDIIENFFVKRGLEGKQIVIGFGKIPFSFTRIILVRKRGSFPENLNDGITLLDEQPPTSISYIDLDVDDLTVYYYQLFYFDENGDVFLNKNLQGKAFTCDTNFFCGKLFNLLPPLYRIEDKDSNQLKLPPVADENAFNEIRRLNSDPDVEKGELERFLCIFGVMLDDALCLIKFMPKLWDIDETCSDFLPLIADLVGIEFNFELSVARQREEIRQAVANFKRRGTLSGITTFINRVSGVNPEINFGKNFIWKFNDPNSTFVGSETVDHQKNYIVLNDQTRYFLDKSENGFAGFEKIIIHLCINDETTSFPIQVIKKIKRLIPEQIPYDARALLILNEKFTQNDELTSFNVNEDIDTVLFSITEIVNNILQSQNLDIINLDGTDFVFRFNDPENGFFLNTENPNHQQNFLTSIDLTSYLANLNGSGFSGEVNNILFISGDEDFFLTELEAVELNVQIISSGFIIVVEEKKQNIDVGGGFSGFDIVETTLTP